MNWTQAIIACIPSAVVGFLVWLVERKITKQNEEAKEYRQKRELADKEKDKQRLTYELLLMNSINSSLDLSVATATAVARIPDAHCNGDMHQALNQAKDAQEKQNNYIASLGLASIQN